MQVRIVSTSIDRDKTRVPKNFGIEITNEEILVPKELVDQLGGVNNVGTPEGLVSVINSFPSVLCSFFAIGMNDVNHTKEQLFKSLRGIVSEEYLHPPSPPPQFPHGAFPPSTI